MSTPETPETPGTPGRRASRAEPAAGRRRPDVTTVLAVALPLLVVAALALVRPDASEIVHASPGTSALTSASVVCPSALDGQKGTRTRLELASTAQTPGSLAVASGTEARRVAVAPGRVAEGAAQDAPVVVSGAGDHAPGIAAGLSSSQPFTAYDCAPVTAGQWFTGVGAGPTHASVLELVNPNAGPAVADVEVLGDDGPVEVPRLRGITVDGHARVQLDLGQVVPRTGELALHAMVVRGQLGIAVRDRGERLTGGTTTEDWLPAQAQAGRRNLLLGVQPGSGRHTLTIANDGDGQVSATIRIVTAGSTFAPRGVKPIVVEPHSVTRTYLDELLADDLAKDAIGLEVDAPQPVTSSLRSIVGGDLSILTPGGRVSSPTILPVPQGAKRLVLAGADAVGVATVVARSADGRTLLDKRVSLAPDEGAAVDLPDGAALVQVTPARTSVRGAVLVTGGGSAVVRLRELVRSGRVPAVAPGIR